MGELKVVDVLHQLLGLGDEIVPHDFDADLHVRVGRLRNDLANLFLRARVALVVILGVRVADLAGHQQHGVGPVELGVVDRRAQGRDPLGPHRRVGIRKPDAPMHRIDDAVNLDAGLLLSRGGLLAIDVAGAVELDALESQRLDQLEFLFDRRAGHFDHAVLHGFLQARPLGLGSGQQRARQRQRRHAGGQRRLQELATAIVRRF